MFNVHALKTDIFRAYNFFYKLIRQAIFIDFITKISHSNNQRYFAKFVYKRIT